MFQRAKREYSNSAKKLALLNVTFIMRKYWNVGNTPWPHNDFENEKGVENDIILVCFPNVVVHR